MGTQERDIKTELILFSIFWRPRGEDEKFYQSKQLFQVIVLFLPILHDPEIVVT
jgi:hypothetical protein